MEDTFTRDQGGHSDTIRYAKKRIKEIDNEIAKWEGKIADLQVKASKGGVKGNAAKNQLATGYGKTEIDQLEREKEKVQKKKAKAENSDEIKEPGYLWLMDRQERYNKENP